MPGPRERSRDLPARDTMPSSRIPGFGKAGNVRVAVGQFAEMTDEILRFAAQLGVSGVQMNTPRISGETHWVADDLKALVARAAAFGLTLEAIENVPVRFYDRAMLGLDGRDEQIARYGETIRAVGEAGIPVLGYHFMPNGVWRTSRTAPGRGGAEVTAFNMDLVRVAEAEGRRNEAAIEGNWINGRRHEWEDEGPFDVERMWGNYRIFMEAVLPVAREAGVRLALHPDDPPVPELGGVARLFGNVAGFQRAEAIAESTGAGEAWGLDLCLGCCSEMPGGAANVTAMIEHFGPRGRILYVHFRDVQGTVPAFQECFLGEGNWNPAAMMRLLARNGFDGFLLDDHVPHMDGDTEWNHRARAHAIGYMQGLINALELGDERESVTVP
jgi:mannonate dehydratase